MKVFAISGFKRSGKDTLANYFVEKYNFKRISFADPLKNMVSELFRIPRGSFDVPNLKERPILTYPVPATDGFTKMVSEFMVPEFRTEKGFLAEPADIRIKDGILQTFIYEWENLYHTPRSLAILVGSGMRSASASFWVDKAIDEIKNSNQNIVISDLRYRSECEKLTKEFGKDLVTIRINRFDNSPSQDPSELDLVGYNHDFEISNKGTQEELFQKLDNILNEYL